MKIAIAAAGGNVGSRISQNLSKSGVKIVLLGNNASSLEKLKIKNAQISITDISNKQQVLKATQGVDALFWLVPPVMSVTSLKQWYQKVTESGVLAVKENKIKKVVLLSSLGAGAKDDLGTIAFAGDMEKEFDQLDADVLALRPGYFLENFLLQAQSIFDNGTFTFTYDPEHDIPFVSTDDIGDVATKYLLDRHWSGHWKLNVMGPENITLTEAAQRISTVLGKQIVYRQSSLEEARKQFIELGTAGTVQNELIDLYVALGDPGGAYATPRTPEAYTPTSIESVIERKLLLLNNDKT